MRFRHTVLISLVVTIVAPLLISVPVVGASSTQWPKRIFGQVEIYRVPKPVPFGTLVSASGLKKNGVFPRSYAGNVGYGLLELDPYQYPVMTIDHGKHWRVDGGYFGTYVSSVFGAGALASNILAVTKTDAISYQRNSFPGSVTEIRVTTDSGRAWYHAGLPGSVRLVSVWRGVGLLITASVTSYNHSAGTRKYSTTNSGKTWTLVPTS